ncbi:MAG: cupin domain-containing protein [Phycisphaerales bacterium]|nr:cupin domain-containing protein [Phycisphaerales bacterium]
MDPRAEHLIAELQLAPHPEGGFYREFFRSAVDVTPADGRGTRSGLTAIHFLLPQGTASRWHVVRSDEQWTFLEGTPLALVTIDPVADTTRVATLGRAAEGGNPTTVVPAGHWQAARADGAYSLVTCTVGPGFDFADFRLLADDPEACERLRRDWPHHADLL